MIIIQQKIKLVVLLIASIALLIFPLIMPIYYLPFYYLLAVFLLPLSIYRVIRHEHFEQKFLRRWKKAREKGYWINVLIEGARSILLLIAVAIFTTVFVYGLTPVSLFRQDSGEINIAFLLFFIIFLLVFYFIAGLIQYYENETRYNKANESEGKK
ncbi:hypothetical protein [Cytobacillus gottheilii]|uniref:Uncharacterized protein n=1 Tax=Cytobacillus gottheilii TaxID=859144 RepID=A0ABX8F6D8_9BACI|nr:hypothetical protein [Cytobacillus gottheilii]QVY59670.1 hypothetical protein J1899_11360 [Cytobacillus gottheilii]